MSKYDSFEDMTVWKRGMNLAVQIFSLTEKLPKSEDYGLKSQLRRASVSISSNIAEGFGRKHTKDKLNFYYDARGSLSEVKSQLIYGGKVKYFTESELNSCFSEINYLWKELNALIASMTV